MPALVYHKPYLAKIFSFDLSINQGISIFKKKNLSWQLIKPFIPSVHNIFLHEVDYIKVGKFSQPENCCQQIECLQLVHPIVSSVDSTSVLALFSNSNSTFIALHLKTDA